MSKKHRIQNTFLVELKKIPIVTVACEKSGISRNSVYRWRREDKDFAKHMEEAMAEGEELVSDMSESQLLTMIKEKNFSAVRYWLSHRSPKYKHKVEVTTKADDETLSEDQAEIVRQALRLGNILPTNEQNHGS